MLAEFPVPKPEHIDDVVLYLVARGRMIQKSFSGMGARDSVVYIDKIVLGNHLNNSCAVVGNRGEKAFVKFNKSDSALVRIRVVLYVVVVHKPVYNRQAVFAKNLFIEIPGQPFCYFQCSFSSHRLSETQWRVPVCGSRGDKGPKFS